jgi:hypothetical protein
VFSHLPVGVIIEKRKREEREEKRRTEEKKKKKKISRLPNTFSSLSHCYIQLLLLLVSRYAVLFKNIAADNIFLLFIDIDNDVDWISSDIKRIVKKKKKKKKTFSHSVIIELFTPWRLVLI